MKIVVIENPQKLYWKGKFKTNKEKAIWLKKLRQNFTRISEKRLLQNQK